MPAPSSAATAPALQPFPGGNPAPAQPLETPSYQPSLFRDGFREGSGGNKVIPIPTLTPLHPYQRDTARTATQRRPSPRPAAGARSQRHRSDFQQTLGFHDSAPEVRIQPGEAIGCDAPVAAPTHRLVATAVDASLILIAVGVFLGIFFLSGGQVELDRQALSFFIGVTAVIALFYRALWCLANGDSPGMRFAGLRLVDFDGRRPDREQRGIRQVANLLSLLSAGLGLVWALVDEENLTWHDHISKTFPTTD
ncbi:MAG: RDD family protein [Acidobacteriia bacterium]|nr:RDD family protein [Terriglobia bacterium]